MKLSEVAAHYGSAYRFNKETGLAHTNWNRWRRIGYIPMESQRRIEFATNGLLKATWEDSEEMLLKR